MLNSVTESGLHTEKRKQYDANKHGADKISKYANGELIVEELILLGWSERSLGSLVV